MLGLVLRARGGAMSELQLDRAGRRRSPATMPGFHSGRPPCNKGLRYPADPPKVEEIVAVMRMAGDDGHGRRLRGLLVVLWRAGLRIQEAMALAEADLDHRRGALLGRRCGCSPTVRPAPVAPRPRRRDGSRGRAARRHSAQLGHSNLGITSVYL